MTLKCLVDKKAWYPGRVVTKKSSGIVELHDGMVGWWLGNVVTRSNFGIGGVKCL